MGKLGEDGLQDGISVDEIEDFRKGHFKDADPDVQRKWCHVMLYFLPCVCPNYHKWDIKMNTPISQVSHDTDEALVLWFLKFYVADWDRMYEDTLQVQDVHEQANKRRRKEGKHKSKAQLGEYLNMHAIIKQARNERGKGWDEAIMEEARIQDDNNHNRTLTDRMPNATLANQAAKKTYVMLFSDDEDDSPGLGGNDTDSTPVKYRAGV